MRKNILTHINFSNKKTKYLPAPIYNNLLRHPNSAKYRGITVENRLKCIEACTLENRRTEDQTQENILADERKFQTCNE